MKPFDSPHGLEKITIRQLINFGKEAEKRGDVKTKDDVVELLSAIRAQYIKEGKMKK